MMRLIPERAIWVTCILLLVATGSLAQQNRFIYIQSENGLSFYVKLEERIFSSSDAGYLIIPKLPEGEIDFSFGFPKNDWPQQHVTCSLKNDNAGYLLKRMSEKNWCLVDLHTKEITLAKTDEPAASAELVSELATDSFSIILASVVNDRGILSKKRTTADTATVLTMKEGGKSPEKALSTNTPKAVVTPGSIIRKLFREDVQGGINISFLDVTDGSVDTVVVFLPQTPPETVQADTTALYRSENKPAMEEMIIPDIKFPRSESQNAGMGTDSVKIFTDSIQLSSGKVISKEIKCKQTATEKDFMRLHKLMSAEKNELAMINVALKKFRVTCFSTEQIRSLGDLFVNEEGRYKLYVAAFPFVSDPSAFNSLEQQLKDPYYIVRFKAMLHQ